MTELALTLTIADYARVMPLATRRWSRKAST